MLTLNLGLVYCCIAGWYLPLFLYAERDYLELNYEQKNNLSAFYKQATYGSFDPEKAPSSGWLDFVGNDRRYVTSGVLSAPCPGLLGSFTLHFAV